MYFPNQGFHFENICHIGNSQTSKEEALKIKEIVDKLYLSSYEYFSSGKLKSGKITKEEILVIAPYNAQVNLLRNYLDDKARVSTVDKFQGQEAPVSIFSLTASSGDDAPRGLEFLFQPNRLNVAISRAKCLSIIVGSNNLSSTLVNSIKDAELLNTFCKLSEKIIFIIVNIMDKSILENELLIDSILYRLEETGPERSLPIMELFSDSEGEIAIYMDGDCDSSDEDRAILILNEEELNAYEWNHEGLKMYF